MCVFVHSRVSGYSIMYERSNSVALASMLSVVYLAATIDRSCIPYSSLINNFHRTGGLKSIVIQVIQVAYIHSCQCFKKEVSLHAYKISG